ncbi:hypothetical protein Vadar_018666 [Vaccinium darrowii]|uniref:Uncharacterized protein n=1 Tax=Vaccinium darrowii TaxID=229202 RepID=A0ACB7Y7L9_9ERIC|nr:hypothetical protein Vadar_018666 [Vaccinium darrowii]
MVVSRSSTYTNCTTAAPPLDDVPVVNLDVPPPLLFPARPDFPVTPRELGNYTFFRHHSLPRMMTEPVNWNNGRIWDSQIVDHEDGPLNREKLLFAVKLYWTSPASSDH